MIPPTIAFTVNALTSAAKEHSVKRFVYTSSGFAMSLPKPNQSYSIDQQTWNTEAVEASYSDSTRDAIRPWAVYGAANMLAEQEAWKFVKEQKPRFILNTVCQA